jgi:hypothetical protein
VLNTHRCKRKSVPRPNAESIGTVEGSVEKVSVCIGEASHQFGMFLVNCDGRILWFEVDIEAILKCENCLCVVQ